MKKDRSNLYSFFFLIIITAGLLVLLFAFKEPPKTIIDNFKNQKHYAEEQKIELKDKDLSLTVEVKREIASESERLYEYKIVSKNPESSITMEFEYFFDENKDYIKFHKLDIPSQSILKEEKYKDKWLDLSNEDVYQAVSYLGVSGAFAYFDSKQSITALEPVFKDFYNETFMIQSSKTFDLKDEKNFFAKFLGIDQFTKIESVNKADLTIDFLNNDILKIKIHASELKVALIEKPLEEVKIEYIIEHFKEDHIKKIKKEVEKDLKK